MLTAAYRIVLGLAFYLPLEDFLLKWLPVSDFAYLALRQLPDLLTLSAVVLVLVARLVSGERVRRLGGWIDAALLALVGAAAVAVGLNDASPMAALLNLKALLRYVLVAYVLVNVPVDEERIQRLFHVVLAAVGIQMGVAALQLVGGEQVVSFFLPPSTEASFAGLELQFTATWEAARGRVFGTIGQTVGFAGFMIVGLAIWTTTEGERPLRYWGGVLLFGAFLYLSGSRTALFVGFLLVVLQQFLAGRASTSVALGTLAAAAAGIAVALSGVDLTQTEVFSVFTQRYLEIAARQRLGIVVDILPEFLASVSLPRIAFGFSGDPAVIEGFVAAMFNAPESIVRQVGIIEDVYWGAIVIYYGLVGFAAMAYVVGRSAYEALRMRLTHRDERFARELATVALVLLAAAVPLNVAGRTFEVRQFSFYLWTTVGLVFAHRQQILSEADGAPGRGPVEDS